MQKLKLICGEAKQVHIPITKPNTHPTDVGFLNTLSCVLTQGKPKQRPNDPIEIETKTNRFGTPKV